MNISYPFRIDPRGRVPAADDNSHLRDLIEQLLFTAPGERVNRPGFGSGLMQLAFAPNSEALAATVQVTAQSAIQQWLGALVDLDSIDVTVTDSTLTVVVSYRSRLDGSRQTTQFQRAL